METLEGFRCDSTVYTIDDHVYKLMKTALGRKYYRCVNKSCEASYVEHTKGSKLVSGHNHPADKTVIEKYKFLTRLRQRARSENISPPELYTECLQGLSESALKQIGSFKQYKKIIYKAKRERVFLMKKQKESVIIKNPRFTILDGLRSDTKVYLCDNFLYHYRKSFNNKKYFECVQKLCPAKLIHDIVENSSLLTDTHSHPSDKLSVEYYEFLTLLRSRARNESKNPRVLFNECLRDFSQEAACKFGGYEKYKKILYNARFLKEQDGRGNRKGLKECERFCTNYLDASEKREEYLSEDEDGNCLNRCENEEFVDGEVITNYETFLKTSDDDSELDSNNEEESMEYEEIIIQIVNDGDDKEDIKHL